MNKICVHALEGDGSVELLNYGEEIIFCGHWVSLERGIINFRKISEREHLCHIDITNRELICLFEREEFFLLSSGVSFVGFCGHNITWDGENIIFITKSDPDDISRRIKITHEV
jgi:hypothetical protein